MFQSTLRDLITKRETLKTLKKAFTGKLKKDQHYCAILEDLAADKEVCKSYKEKLIQDDPTLTADYKKLTELKEEMTALNEQLTNMVSPVLRDTGEKIDVGQMRINFVF